MQEVNFKDRVPLYPGKIRLVPVPNEPDCFIMERADEPTEQGTPIDKATFNSIIHSRLTGRYYAPEITQTEKVMRANVTTNLFSGTWTLDEDSTTKATNSIFAVESISSNYAVNGMFSSSGWQSLGDTTAWVKIYNAAAIKVKKIKMSVATQYAARFVSMKIQGSKNGTTWTTLATYTSITANTLTDYDVNSTNAYTYYRLLFENTESNRITVANFTYSLYDTVGYSNTFTVDEGLPAVWTKEQRITIVTPSYDMFGVNVNTLNGVNINTLLMPNRRYELRYNGTAFDTKEV